MKFVNLYIQTEYSILKSVAKIKDLVNYAKNEQATALAITDDAMHGTIKFYNQCKDNNIKPIIGLRVDLFSQQQYFNAILLYAMDNVGYQNLMEISTITKTNAKVEISDFKAFNKGIIAIIPSYESEVYGYINDNLFTEAYQSLKNLQDVFPNIYLGIDMQGAIYKSKIDKMLEIAHQLNIEEVAINKTRFLDEKDFQLYQTVRCIDLGINEYKSHPKEPFMSYLTEEEAIISFASYPLALKNTVKIASMCNVEIEFGKFKLPKYFKNDEDPRQYLHDLCMFGLSRRLNNKNVDKNKYIERLKYELSIIHRMNFDDYFLVVYDFIKYAKRQGVLVGPGRGSGAGSLVAYCLGITEADPLEFNLLFERFLNPERSSMPDIDTDFPDNRRDEIIRYVASKYGARNVTNITAFGTLGPRSAIRDVARVLKTPEMFLNEVMKHIPNYGSTLPKIIANNQSLERMISENDDIKLLLDLASRLEGLPRNLTTHAAGIIITSEDIVKYAPLQKGINGLYQTQYEAEDLERLGLVKMDFLAIRNLTIIDEVTKEIEASENIKISVNDIPFDDKETYAMIASGDTDGIFQLESGGMRSVLTRLKTSCLDDIINANALYRPGPMEMIPTFIKRKFKEEKVNYLHKDLEPILKSTYGIIVFQEQIMLIAQKIAGFTLGQADILRRAMSKKKSDVLAAQRKTFIESSIKNGYDEKTSSSIYDYIEKFANYGFNKSHSVVYSIVSYRMAYLKCHYYKYFMANLMTNSISNIPLIKLYISNCNKRSIEVKLPSVNRSTKRCVVYDNSIYLPLTIVDNMGSVTAEEFINERQINGLYKSYQDFIDRTKTIINKRIFESLVSAGALDEFNLTRKTMIENYDEILGRQNYDLLSEQLKPLEFSKDEYEFQEIASKEFSALGFNYKYNILKQFAGLREKYHTININQFVADKPLKLLAVINRVKVIKTKKNEEMAFIELNDDIEIIDAVVFPTVYQKHAPNLTVGAVAVFLAVLEIRNEKKQLKIENVYIINK